MSSFSFSSGVPALTAGASHPICFLSQGRFEAGNNRPQSQIAQCLPPTEPLSHFSIHSVPQPPAPGCITEQGPNASAGLRMAGWSEASLSPVLDTDLAVAT